jgi:hypothetical protein
MPTVCIKGKDTRARRKTPRIVSSQSRMPNVKSQTVKVSVPFSPPPNSSNSKGLTNLHYSNLKLFSIHSLRVSQPSFSHHGLTVVARPSVRSLGHRPVYPLAGPVSGTTSNWSSPLRDESSRPTSTAGSGLDCYGIERLRHS